MPAGTDTQGTAKENLSSIHTNIQITAENRNHCFALFTPSRKALYLYLRFVLSHGRSAVLTKAFDLKVVSAGVGSRMGNELEFMGKLVVFGQLFLSLWI